MSQAIPAPERKPERRSETMTAAVNPSLFRRLKSGLARRWLLCGLALLSLLTLVFWRPVQRQCLTFLLLRADAPSPEVLSDVTEQTGNPKSLLLRLWQSQHIPQRRFVVGYLGRAVNSKPDLFRAMESVMLDAASDADFGTRELAFATLTRTKHPQLLALALDQLEDADPAVRVLGLQSLRSIASSNEVPIAMHLLSDADPRVVVAASLVLRQTTGQDFGLKSSLALPRFTSIDKTNPASPPDLAAINQGIQRWRDWWKEHQVEYSASTQLPRESHRLARLAASDFTLEDSEGKRVRRSDYHGKAVLLAFWSSDAPVAFDDAPALNALHSREVVVLGICVPPAPSCADEHKHDHNGEHAHHHDDASFPATSPSQMRALIQRMALENKIEYPMLLDAKGTVGLRFGVEDIPTYVLIDAQGMIRRVFPGNRTQAVLEAMVAEVAGTKIPHNKVP